MFKLSVNLLFCGGVLLASIAHADIIDGEEFIDPTRPFYLDLATGDETLPDLFRTVVPASYDVTFVRAGNASPLAVINNQRVTVGDLIGGATVVAIDRSGVTLLINDEEKRISVYGTTIKMPVTER